ncbi:MAG: hypothetical protein MJA32_03910 [Proteobacteria bacterium]|nr:hypothetical protein [Pseudomonadota bacterium]
MKTNNRKTIRDTVELVGIIAVVLSLLLVAYEVRQSNRIAQATTTYEIGRDVNQFNELGYSDPEFAALLVKLRDPDFKPSKVEAMQVRLLANRFVNLWTIQEKAYRNGLLSDVQFAMTKADVVTVMGAFPALIEHWGFVLRDQPRLTEYIVLKPIMTAVSAED